MEEPTPVCSFFTNKYNQLQNQDYLPSSSGLQLSPRFQAKIGLFISFLALAASFEVLLASSIGKSAFPNDSAVSDFLTRPLSNSHKHFTNGTLIGIVGLLLSLVAFAYFINRLREKTTELICPTYGMTFWDSYILTGKEGGDRYQTHNYYRFRAINDPENVTLAVIIKRDNASTIRVGIPYSKYLKNTWCGYIFEEEIQKLKENGHLTEKEYHCDRFIVTPIENCFNLNNLEAVQSNNVI